VGGEIARELLRLLGKARQNGDGTREFTVVKRGGEAGGFLLELLISRVFLGY
jgi:hypothetical protein